MQAYSVPCWWVVWWLWRAGCISQDTYLLYKIPFFALLKSDQKWYFDSGNCFVILDVSDLLTDPFLFFKEMLHVELHKCADLRDCHKNCKGAEEHVVFDGQSQPAWEDLFLLRLLCLFYPLPGLSGANCKGVPLGVFNRRLLSTTLICTQTFMHSQTIAA